ncbi:MAG: sulfofructosephosphate aldolase [Gaiellales bacterium]|nr:sulfofructosephosphate aldolase [Gaiellales bacterium]
MWYECATLFTTAETRALTQLTSPSGRRAVVAADQRTSLVKARLEAGQPADPEALRDFKLDLVEALAPLAPAMLLDPEIALPAVINHHVLPGRTGLLVSLEQSGAPRVGDARPGSLIPNLGAAGVRRLGGTAAKLLVYLRTDREGADDHNGRLVREAVADCAQHDLLLIVEAVVHRLPDEDEAAFARARPTLIRDAAVLLEQCGVRYLKLEYPGDERGCRDLTEAVTVPWALLSAGVDHETFLGQLEVALAAGASGFIAGRSIWKEAALRPRAHAHTFLRGEGRRRLEQLLELVARA